MKYVKNVLIAIDQLANALLGGDPDSTISSRMHHWTLIHPYGTWRYWIGTKMSALLHLIDRNHCADAYEKGEHKNDLF